MLTDPLRLAILCSKRAPGLSTLLQHPLRGSLFEVDRVVTAADFTTSETPVAAHPMPGRAQRREYDARTATLLAGADVVLLLGYLFILTEPMLDAFPNRILNIHDADLLLRRPDGGPRYPGLHSTRDAIIAGERETRSSAHIVTSELDGGPVVARSRAFPVAPFALDAVAAGAGDIVRAYVYAQREWMIRSAWAALAIEALDHLSARRVAA
jgi:folate-dependent phosphoribosylglycinamide formyltransferase PurN